MRKASEERVFNEAGNIARNLLPPEIANSCTVYGESYSSIIVLVDQENHEKVQECLPQKIRNLPVVVKDRPKDQRPTAS